MNLNYEPIIQSIQVNIPFTMLQETYLDRFLEYRLNPEIGLDAYALETFSLNEFKQIAAAVKEYHPTITLHAPYLDLSPGSKDPAILNITRRRFEQVLELIPLFQPISIVAHAGYDKKRYGFDSEEWAAIAIETWSWFARRCESVNTRLMLENVYEQHPHEIQVLFENLAKETVGFCLDTGHITAFGNSSLDIWVSTMKPYIRQVHLHDNLGDWDDHIGLGKGNIDFQSLMDYLASQKEHPPIITLEPHTEKSLCDSIEFLANHWPFN